MTVVSFRHRFVFIKTKKTGGTAAEMALSACCGPEDIVAPISFEDERDRMSNGSVAARNFNEDASLCAALVDAVLASDEKAFLVAKRRSRQHGGFYNHMPAKKIRARLSPEFWAAACKCTVERHPYEKIISRAYYLRRDDPSEANISATIERLAHATSDSTRLYTINGGVAVDRFLRQECLAKDLASLASDLGLGPLVELPSAKSNYRKDRRPAREILSNEQREAIYRNHRQVFDLLGYEP